MYTVASENHPHTKFFYLRTDSAMNLEQTITFIFGVLVIGLWLFLKVCRKHNSDLPAKSLRALDRGLTASRRALDRGLTASRILIRVVAFLVGCLLWWLPLSFMPDDIEGLFCMGSFGTLLIIYGLVGPNVITKLIKTMDDT
jgi:hypothetical protein